MPGKTYDAIIIGAGHNGLATAAYLAKAGLSVLVLERVDKVGGAITTDEIFPGFHGPFCAYVCHMVQGKVVDDLDMRRHGFEIAGGGAGQVTRSIHPYPDGTYIGGPNVATVMDMAHQIREQFSENDARALFGWNDFWDQAASILAPYFLTDPPSLAELMDSVRGSRREEVLEKMLTWSFMDVLNEYFEDDRVQANFLSGSLESDPEAPGSVMSKAYFRAGQSSSRDMDRGIPRGSMGAFTLAMANAAKSFGVEIRTGAPVSEVIVEGGVARGVRMADGSEMLAPVVVSNADPKRTFLTLVKPEDAGEANVRKARHWKTVAGCVKFLAALKEPPDLSRYLGGSYDRKAVVGLNICPSVEYHLASWADAKAGRVSTNPIMHVQMPSLVDPDLVPRGGVMLSNWVLYYPPKPRDGAWDDVKQDVGENIIDIITEYAPNFRSSLIDWMVQTPEDIELRTGLTDGNIRHGDMIPSQMLTQRFAYRTGIRGLYMCGSGTHPGGEVTGAPGHNAAHAILMDMGRGSARRPGAR